MTEAEPALVREEISGDVLVLSIDNPPANDLSPPVRAALLRGLTGAGAGRAVVIRAEGRNFSAPTALDCAGDESARPTLGELCAAVDRHPQAVVMALNGLVIGAAAELALAAHVRVASPLTRLAFADVGLGLVPGAGTTQRLPRLVGTIEAIALLLRGRPATATEALEIGLVDRVVDSALEAAAVAQGAAMPGPRPTALRHDRQSDPQTHAAAIAAARAEALRGVLPAPKRIIDCVEASLYLPFEAGLAMEAVAREDLAATPEAQGLMAVARAERHAARLPAAVAKVRPREITHLGLSGGAPQFATLALMALGQGMRVSWFDADAARLDRAQDWIAARQDEEIRLRRLTPLQRDADRSRLFPLVDAASLASARLVIHTQADADFARLAARGPSVPQLVLGGAEGALGLALSPSARSCELAVPPDAPPGPVAATVLLLRRLGLSPVLVNGLPVVGRRVSGAGRAALARLLALGVPRDSIAAALDEFGQATPALADPDSAPVAARAMPRPEILRRWLAAMANEGLRLLDAGVARCPSDIDWLMVAGHGMPRWRGGPMYQASLRGLLVLRADLQHWRDDDPLWAPHPLIDHLIAEGLSLSDLNRAELNGAD